MPNALTDGTHNSVINSHMQFGAFSATLCRLRISDWLQVEKAHIESLGERSRSRRSCSMNMQNLPHNSPPNSEHVMECSGHFADQTCLIQAAALAVLAFQPHRAVQGDR